jgi:hypothetical protein
MPLFGAQRDVRDLLREKAEGSNVKWTVVSTGIFMSFLFEAFWGIVSEEKEKEKGEVGKIVVRCLKDWEHKVTVTHVDDIGRVPARILAGDTESENRVLNVAGDTVSYEELAEVVGRASGCNVEEEKWSIPHLKGELARDPEDGIKKYSLCLRGMVCGGIRGRRSQQAWHGDDGRGDVCEEAFWYRTGLMLVR